MSRKVKRMDQGTKPAKKEKSIPNTSCVKLCPEKKKNEIPPDKKTGSNLDDDTIDILILK